MCTFVNKYNGHVLCTIKITFFLHFSAYQVIVLRVTDGVEDLPDDYDSKLKDKSNKDNLNFYIAAELKNNPVHEESWEFTVGDKEKHGAYENKELERGEQYVIYQRAITLDKSVSRLGGTYLNCSLNFSFLNFLNKFFIAITYMY